MNSTSRLVRKQLDKSLERYAPLAEITPPLKGWIRAIRDAVGMTARQLARRIGVAQQAVARIEKGELSGSVTIKTMRRIADSLDCVFVYGFVPRTSLENTVRRQAANVAAKTISMASHTMALEAQNLPESENKSALEDLTAELVDKLPPTLWSEQ